MVFLGAGDRLHSLATTVISGIVCAGGLSIVTDSSEINPFAAALEVAETYAGAPDAEVERIRRAHLSHESSIKSVGALYTLGAILLAMGAAGLLVGTFMSLIDGQLSGDSAPMILLGLVYGGVSALQFWVGRGLRKLDSRVRIAAVVLSVIGLIGVPIGTIISLYVLWLLLSQKGKYILSPEYRQVVIATPQVKHKTSIVVWVVFIVLLLLLATIIISVAFI